VILSYDAEAARRLETTIYSPSDVVAQKRFGGFASCAASA
jgi:hypothetical protein